MITSTRIASSKQASIFSCYNNTIKEGEKGCYDWQQISANSVGSPIGALSASVDSNLWVRAN